MKITISKCEGLFNQELADYLRSKGNIVNTLSSGDLLDDNKNKNLDMDVFINGLVSFDESKLYMLNPEKLSFKLIEEANLMFLTNQKVAEMMLKKKEGSIIFLLKYDVLRYLGLQTSPIWNNAVISFIKSLSKELSSYKISVNVITLGSEIFFNKKDKEKLKIFSLKPRKINQEELFCWIEGFLKLKPNYLISGQNIELSPGTETSI